MAAETAVIVTNILCTGSFVGVSAYFATKWMTKVDLNADRIERDRKSDAKALADDLKEITNEHRIELKSTTDKLEGHLNQIYDQIRIANGRTSKLEGGLNTIKEVCNEKHRHDGDR